MSSNVFMAFKCLNPECGKTIQLARPEITNVYAVTCPHCGVKKALKLIGQDNFGKEQNHAAQAELKKPDVEDNSAKQAILIEEDFVVGSQHKILCPHCKKQEIAFSSQKPGMRSINCPKCKGIIKFDVRPLTEKIIITEAIQKVKGKLVLLRKGWLNKEFKLKEGKQTIGRFDEDVPSDISVKNDSSMSRRSIMIDVIPSMKGYIFKLNVLKATNPVLINNNPLLPGEAVSLNFGDIILLGKTKFRFDKDS